jgi:hypothetical protein
MNHQYREDSIREFLNYEFLSEILTRELTEAEILSLEAFLDNANNY